MDLLAEIQVEIANFRTLEKANERVKSLQYETDKGHADILVLEKRLEKEYQDYASLEGKSIKGLFYSVLGSKEDQLEKERQEYLQLSLQYDQAKESLKLKEFELEVLQKKVLQFRASKTKIADLKLQREAFLFKAPTTDGQRLRKVIKNMDAATRLHRDIDEALAVGQQLTGAVSQMIKLLSSARNWGKWDVYNKNKTYKYHKRTNIDRAQRSASQIQSILGSFVREVRDVYPDFRGIQVNFDLNRLNGFTDVFFDNLISDWIVQQKIVNSLNDVKTFHDRVTRLLQSLQVDKEKTVNNLTQLNQDKDDLLMGK